MTYSTQKRVVYHPFPTSNHNLDGDGARFVVLYIILFLHQTTTIEIWQYQDITLYIILFLHQTTTASFASMRSRWLYIILFLHQTTTWRMERVWTGQLYIILFLHQTTTFLDNSFNSFKLYIILFLHQTTTVPAPTPCAARCISSFSYIKPQLECFAGCWWLRCISSFSYIKPQQLFVNHFFGRVVYHPFPTSNHNNEEASSLVVDVVYHPFPTSNHNLGLLRDGCEAVVYHPFPTSNHNTCVGLLVHLMLYIILFLHQTTTY